MNVKPKINKVCTVCSITFIVSPSRASGKHERKVCGMACSAELSKKRKPFLGKKHTIESKIKNSESSKGKPAWNKGLIGFMSGEKHHWYGRDVTGEKNPAYKKDRNSLKKGDKHSEDSAYMDWRKQVYTRDNFKCKMSNTDCNGKIEAHHILPWRNHPELRYNVNNGITLCHKHHPRKWKEEVEMSPFFNELINITS